MGTCAAHFAVVRFFVTSARPNYDELELTHQEGRESRKDGELQRPGTRPGIRHEDGPSYSLSSRGVGPGR